MSTFDIIIVWSDRERCVATFSMSQSGFLKNFCLSCLFRIRQVLCDRGSLSTHQLEIKLLFGPESSSEFSFGQSSSVGDEAELVVLLASVCIQKATATALALVEEFNGLDNHIRENRQGI